MLVVISPAKALDMSPVDHDATEPLWPDDAMRLAKTARNLTLGDLKGLMKISDNLAKLNRDRFRDFQPQPEASATKPAAFAFNGDTYRGLEADTLSDDAIRWAQDHLRILSGLYGLLRPLDAIQPYRLEMGSRLKTRRGKSLYEYWGDQIAQELTRQADEIGTDILVNCASQEYFTAANRPSLGLRVIAPRFLEAHATGPRIVSIFAKQARGAMARFIVENRLTDPGDLLGFEAGGYRHVPELSNEGSPAFLRGDL